MLSSCVRNNSHSESDYKQLNKTVVKAKKDSIKEDFFSFLRDFSISPEFQKQRIKFPLKDYYLNSEHTIVFKNITVDKWRTVALLDTSHNTNTISVIYDNFERKFRDSNERVYAIQGIETDIANFYYFKNMSGKWFLIKREDFSY